MEERRPTASGVAAAAGRISKEVTRTPLLPLDHEGRRIWVKAECLQYGGSFKLRGATNRLVQLSAEERARGVVAFSSGNHARGVALAARKLGIHAAIVMPSDAPRVKRDNTLALGAEVVTYDRATESREKIAAHLAHARGAVLVPSFDDAWVIEGQGSAGIEAEDQFEEFGIEDGIEHVVTPCGGGGLAAGLALALPDAAVTVVEPEGWDDMRRSLEAGWIEEVAPDAPPTACDSLQTKRVSQLTFDVLSRRGATGVAVSEAEVRAAQRWAAAKLRLVVEPGGAVAIAALLSGKVPPQENMLVIVSGGNVDPDAYAAVLGRAD